MFILKTNPQQSYAFKEGISFAHSWICLLLFSIKTYCGHTGENAHHFVFVILIYVQKNKVISPHLI